MIVSPKFARIIWHMQLQVGLFDCYAITAIYHHRHHHKNMTSKSDTAPSYDPNKSDPVMDTNEPQITDVAKKTSSDFTIDKSAYTIVREGKAEVLFPSSHDVFYNPVQEFNRDLSVAVLREYVKECFLNKKGDEVKVGDKSAVPTLTTGKSYGIDGVTVLEALAASGLRSLRYALEVPGIKHITANDVSSQACESIVRNVKHNAVEHLVSPNREDAALYMYMHCKYKERFQVVDLDPYGSPTTFLDAAVQSVHDGGLLMVTCTDMAVLCGNGSETCYAKYGSVSLKTKCCHEMALRIVLQCIESHANRYGRYIVPLLSVSVDFYVRIFVQLFTSPATVKRTTSKLAMVYQCTGCETLTLQPLGNCTPTDNGKQFKYSLATNVIGQKCSHCQRRLKVGGPIWADRLHNFEFVEKVLNAVEANAVDFKTSKRILGTLSVVSEELPDVPLYYTIDRLSGVLHSVCPKMTQIRSALLNSGYRVSISHACRTSIKTNAPADFLWDMMRIWVKANPIRRELSDESAAKAILTTEPSHSVSFEIHDEANPDSRKNKLVRFQENPERYWGPKMRSKTSLLSETQNSKSVKNQGKRSSDTAKDAERRKADLKSFPCKRFKKGKCDLADKCRYSHVDLPEEGSNENVECGVVENSS